MQRSAAMVDRCGVTVAEHVVATTRGGARTLLEPQRAAWLWSRLRAGLPQALSCVLMPDHVHLVVRPGRRPRLRRILSAYTALYGTRFDVLEPQAAMSTCIAGRMMRYGFFNPVRAGLVDDPFAWGWSTLRDLVGAAHPVWTRASSIAAFLGLPEARALHGLTTLGGITVPTPQPTTVQCVSFDHVRGAVRAATRSIDPFHRARGGARLFVQACYTVGAPRPAEVASALGCTVRSVRRYRAPRAPALPAVILCLGDARLRYG